MNTHGFSLEGALGIFEVSLNVRRENNLFLALLIQPVGLNMIRKNDKKIYCNYLIVNSSSAGLNIIQHISLQFFLSLLALQCVIISFVRLQSIIITATTTLSSLPFLIINIIASQRYQTHAGPLINTAEQIETVFKFLKEQNNELSVIFSQVTS